MNGAMTIEEFHTLLTSEPEKESSPLLRALRELTAIERPEDILALAEEEPTIWSSWESV